jgi:excinuclease ABC subunit A
MVGVAGMSGSGKSSLISDTLVPLLEKQLKHYRKMVKKSSKKSKFKAKNNNGEIEEMEDLSDPLEIIKGTLEGWEMIDDIVVVNQSPIGRTRTSTPASYIGVWKEIRKLFAKQPLGKKRKYREGHFSFNSDRGRCPVCNGHGVISLQISFLDEISMLCEECNGARYQPQILEVDYKGKNIKEILDMTVTDALNLFKGQNEITKYLKILDEIGMGYINLGQSARTLSGGEAQRIKLAKALGSSKRSNTLFVLDEPTTGLHFHDEVKLLKLLDKLVEQGNSVLIIEHNTNVLSYCDWIIELGPKGGPKGGMIIGQGTPEELNKNSNSIIGEFI